MPWPAKLRTWLLLFGLFVCLATAVTGTCHTRPLPPQLWMFAGSAGMQYIQSWGGSGLVHETSACQWHTVVVDLVNYYKTMITNKNPGVQLIDARLTLVSIPDHSHRSVQFFQDEHACLS
jgi:hypothetical protein